MMPGYVLALGALATLPSKLKGGIFDMEQDNKTITMPLSEFEDMRAKLAQKGMSEEEVKKLLKEKEEEISKQKEREFEKLIGQSVIFIEKFIEFWKKENFIDAVVAKYNDQNEVFINTVREVEEKNKTLLLEKQDLERKIAELEAKIKFLKSHKKWWQFWK